MNIAAIYPIKPLYNDPNVCLIKEDEVVFAYEEETLSRRRRDLVAQAYPSTALHAALKKAGLRPNQIDVWALVGAADDVIGDFTSLLRNIGLIHYVPDLKINRVPHHLAHVALSVLTAPFDECLYVCMDDGGGNATAAAMGVFRGNRFHEIHRTSGLHLSNFWSDMTQSLGFGQFDEEKLMGLAAYGSVDEKLYRQLTSIIRVGDDGLGILYRPPRRIVEQDPDSFSCDDLSPSRTAHGRFDFRSVPCIREVSKPDIAATVQKLTQDYVAEIVSSLIRKTGISRVALCGSLFRNCRLNGALCDLLDAVRVHVPMAPGDDGLSLGAALYTLWESGKSRRPIAVSPYVGPAFDDKSIEEEIKSFGLKYRRSFNAPREAAQLIAQGKVAGWFQDAGEYGPRSLGGRSVIADPRNPLAKERINVLLKNPHWFVPYAPSILEEYMDEFFERACRSPYMNIAFRAREEKARLIPGAVHADGASIPQSVGKTQNKRYYELIEEFKRLTGLPLVLNAGFSVCGAPAVSTPRHALEHLCMGCVDVLVIGDYIVEREFLPKEEQPPKASESHLIAGLKARPVVDLALAGKTRRALEICSGLGIPCGNGIDALILELSNERERKELADMLLEQLADLIEASEPQRSAKARKGQDIFSPASPEDAETKRENKLA